jgi:hypothetical protein
LHESCHVPCPTHLCLGRGGPQPSAQCSPAHIEFCQGSPMLVRPNLNIGPFWTEWHADIKTCTHIPCGLAPPKGTQFVYT